MTSPEALISRAKALLLDFDGPITTLMPPPRNRAAANRARQPLEGLHLPVCIAETNDHLAVLRWTFRHAPSRLASVELACTEVEVECARTSELGPEIGWLLDLARINSLPVGIASNNSEAAVRLFAERMDLGFEVYACRTPESVRLMKPSPAYVLACADWLRVPARETVFVGDSVSDVEAGRAAGVAVIGLAKSPDRRAGLIEAGACAVIERT